MAYKELKASDTAGQSDWHRHCRATKTVDVQVLSRTKYARVEWDFISVPVEREADLRAQKEHLLDSLKGVFSQYASSNSIFDGSELVGHMDGLLIERARLAADQISNIFEAVPKNAEQ